MDDDLHSQFRRQALFYTVACPLQSQQLSPSEKQYLACKQRMMCQKAAIDIKSNSALYSGPQHSQKQQRGDQGKLLHIQ
eukprot:scaffold245693_cov19-Tisochrysis_lutea.AAC.1